MVDKCNVEYTYACQWLKWLRYKTYSWQRWIWIFTPIVLWRWCSSWLFKQNNTKCSINWSTRI